MWRLKKQKNIYIQFENYFTPHVQYVPSFFRPCTNSSHRTCLGLQFYTSPIALTRGIYSSFKWWHYIRDKRKKFQGAYKLFCWTRHSHLVGVWNEINREAVCLCRRRTHAEMSHPLLHSWKLAGDLVLKSRLGRNTNKSHFLVLQVILSYISIQVFQLELWHHFWTGGRSFSVSGEGVRVFRFSVLSQVLRALVHSVSLWLVWCCSVCLPLDVHDSMCTSVSETASAALSCARGTDYRKALGFARGSFWFL